MWRKLRFSTDGAIEARIMATLKAARAAPPVARHAKSAPPDQGILIGPGVSMFLVRLPS
jgi:hypothetical protein